MKKRVAILGGVVAGMTAAHELIQRGFEVTVFELHPHRFVKGSKRLNGLSRGAVLQG